jgi:uncharacterized protein
MLGVFYIGIESTANSMTVGIIFFLTAALSTWTGMHYYVYSCLAQAGVDRTLLLTVLWILYLGFPLTRVLTFKGRNSFLRIFYWIGAMWVGVVFLLSFWFMVSTGLRKILLWVGFINPVSPILWIQITAMMVLAIILWGFYKAMSGPKDTRFLVNRHGRYGLGRSLRIIQISDVHLGLTLGVQFLEKLVERINRIEPDLVFITGDFFDPEFPSDAGAIAALKKLRPREGTYAVSGNHEFYSGINRFLSMMKDSGIKVLDNETMLSPSGIQISGIHDQTANRFKGAGVSCDLPKALATVNSQVPSILLAHQPKELEPAVASQVDLILSGHTHAGQIFPFRFLVNLAYRYLGGRYQLGPNTDLIVCTGTGFWGPPLRVGTDSQIVIIDFKV